MTSIFSFTSKVDGVDDHLAAHVNSLQSAADVVAGGVQGQMLNGKLSVTVASNNITVAIKTLDSADPSASDPVIFRVGNTLRMLTTSLSVTKNAGTNWFGSGGTKFATEQIDYFVYVIWNTGPATDILDIGFARVPWGRTYNDFSSTTTSELYLAYGNATIPSTADELEVIGRFNAILSATASFNWSLPATQIVINRPIYHTRRLTWVPALGGYSSDPTSALYQYVIDKEFINCFISEGGDGTSDATNLTVTMPFTAVTVTNGTWTGYAAVRDNGAGVTTTGRLNISSGGTTMTAFPNFSASSTWTAASGKRIVTGFISYPIN